MVGLAIVELNEAQRRALSGDGAAALPLARRSRIAFSALGMEDQAARGLATEALAYSALGRLEESIRACREAIPTFERHGLWANYVGAVNSAATSLQALGRLDEARRDYARAYRRISRTEHRSWLGFLRGGLAEVFFAAGRFPEAAAAASAASGLFRESGLTANALLVGPLEIESWSRAGRHDRARARVRSLRAELRRARRLDPDVRARVEGSLTRAKEGLSRLRRVRHTPRDPLVQPASR